MDSGSLEPGGRRLDPQSVNSYYTFEIDSSSVELPQARLSQRLAEAFGIAIALLTLVLPIVAIASFSTLQVEPVNIPSQRSDLGD